MIQAVRYGATTTKKSERGEEKTTSGSEGNDVRTTVRLITQ
jgi:hypothetical protein